MADPFVAEIRIVPFHFAPRGWAFCAGQLLPIAMNVALFSLMGTTYGGNGMSNFALPDLQGRAPMQPGQGPGLSLHDLGESGGAETVTLLTAEMPAHSHGVSAQSDPAATYKPGPPASLGRASNQYQSNTAGNLVTMAQETLVSAGGDQPHNNMMPYLTLNFIIALQGVFPPRP